MSIKTVTDFPFEIETIEHQWIPMSDGCRLSARVWWPKGAPQSPVPAILEYIPYRKRDHTRTSDEQMYNYLAGHGYACVRVDMRGSGDSEGVLEDEYLEREQDDGVEVLRWIGQQSWCSGKVGMIGISWGGFNALQIAAKQPPELGAIITVCSTDDRYADDVHYMGGCLLGDNLSWASVMFARNTQPPDPLIVGDQWKELWLERLRKSGLWLAKWMRHQRRDDYWKHGSVCEEYGAIKCPVYAVGGWADGYTNAIFRLLENLEVPRKGLVGPWSHVYPHLGRPRPAIGFLQESLRWWDRWLKGDETNGIMEEPMLAVWMQSHAPPAATVDERPGRWVSIPRWPTDQVKRRAYALDEHRIAPEGRPVCRDAVTFQSPLSVGLLGGKWCSYSATPDLPHDQRDENGGAEVFTSRPFEKALEILGSPVLELEISADEPVAMIAARLSDVAPDDSETRVTYGVLNLTHRDSHEHPEPLEPSKRYRVRLPLNQVAQHFEPGHRLNLAVSSSYWPIAWPAPERVRLTIHLEGSRLVLPVRRAPKGETGRISFEEPVVGPSGPVSVLEQPRRNWVITRDLAADVTNIDVVDDNGKVRYEDIGMEVGSRSHERFSYIYNDYGSLRGETAWEMSFRRGDWTVSTRTRTILTSTQTHFHIRAELDAYDNESRVHCASWNEAIPRDLL